MCLCKNKLHHSLEGKTLLTLQEAAEIFRYNSVGSARKAHSRGQFPVQLYRFEKKSGYYARVDEVLECINNMTVS